MDTKTIGILCGIGGLVIGAVGGFIAGVRWNEAKYETMADEAGDWDYQEWDPDETDGEIPHMINPSIEKGASFVNSLMQKPDLNVLDYTKYATGHAAVEGEQLVTIESIEEESTEVVKETVTEPIRIFDLFDHEPVPEKHEFELLSCDDYLYDQEDIYEKATATYFTEDDVLAGPDNSIERMNIDTTIGTEAYELLKYEKADGIYSRNETTKTDYEVVISTASYEDAVKESEWNESD